MKIDGSDIHILVHLWHEGARSIELDGDPKENRRRLQRLRKAGLCGCSRIQGLPDSGGRNDPIWGISPRGIDAVEQAESDCAGKWRKLGWSMEI